jgi:D-alanine--poly(phosphoribitol) ligase subunit 1
MNYSYNLGIRFSEVVAVHPLRNALMRPNVSPTTYADIDQLSNRIGRYLTAQGVRKGHVVALFHDKSAAAFATMLACLKLGVIYTNLDPESPWERLRKILKTCEPRLVINAFEGLPHVELLANEGICRVINLHSKEIRLIFQQFECVELSEIRSVTSSDPAYIMFTSGSTGTPKGAVMSHANVLNFVEWARERFQITPDDVLTNVNPIYFDNSVFDFYCALFSGAALVPVLLEEARTPRTLVSLVNNLRCTIWFSVPSLLVYLLTTRALTPTDFPAIRKIIFGGEGFPKPKLKQLFDLYHHRAKLENVYGPTECTCICSAHTLVEDDFSDMHTLTTLGFLAPNFDYEILPSDLLIPDEGELFLRGPNIGLGYYKDPDRTAKSFVQNPRHSRYADIGYRTGDLVSRDVSGQLHFKGRADFQVKHMGYRIELEEIEAALNTLAAVNESAVIYYRRGDGLGQILAFVSLSNPADPADLLAEVTSIVPPYMVPKRIIVLEALPKNANGKIDRIALQTVIETQS